MAITRCGNFYGGGDLNWNRIVPGTIRSVLRGERPVIRSDGQFVRDYFYVEDGADAYMTLAEALAARPELAGRGVQLLQRDPGDRARPGPARSSDLMESDLEPDVRNEASNEIVHQYLSAAKARRELGWAPLFDLDEGLRRTIEWYQEFLANGRVTGPIALRAEILDLVRQLPRGGLPARTFVPGDVARALRRPRLRRARSWSHLVDASLDFWLTTGRFAEQFEREFAAPVRRAPCPAGQLGLVGQPGRPLVPDLAQAGRPTGSRPGDEVITVAAGFPTTVNPIIQNNLVPVFVDVHVPTYNIDVTPARSGPLGPDPGDHGRPHAGQSVRPRRRDRLRPQARPLADRGLLRRRRGDLSGPARRHLRRPGDRQLLPGPPHHDGRGGRVLTNRPRLKKLVESFRDWGRDCWCDPGKDNTCGKRFDWQLGDLPHGYDHKYIYSHIGYNLKLTDMQAAVGVAQLGKLDGFVAARRANFARLHAGARRPRRSSSSCPRRRPARSRAGSASRSPSGPRRRSAATSWSTTSRTQKIGTRQIFARQPAAPAGLSRTSSHRQVGDLANSDFVMNQAFWVGVYPGYHRAMIDFMVEAFETATRK